MNKSERKIMKKALDVLNANHVHHQEYDDYGDYDRNYGYDGSDLRTSNVATIKALRTALKVKCDSYAVTKDGVSVRPGDKVWVNGSTSIEKTTVCEPATSYYLFGIIPVSESFSTKQAAKKARY